MEFAITLLLNQKKKSDLNSQANSAKNEKRENSRVIPQAIKVKPTTADFKLNSPTVKPEEITQGGSTLMINARKMVSIVPITHAIDFLAVWVYFILFLVFNYIYWKSY